MKHKFYDDDIETVEDLNYSDNIRTCYLSFKNRGSGALAGVVIHKDDVIALANYFGLVVYEKGVEKSYFETYCSEHDC